MKNAKPGITVIVSLMLVLGSGYARNASIVQKKSQCMLAAQMAICHYKNGRMSNGKMKICRGIKDGWDNKQKGRKGKKRLHSVTLLG